MAAMLDKLQSKVWHYGMCWIKYGSMSVHADWLYDKIPVMCLRQKHCGNTWCKHGAFVNWNCNFATLLLLYFQMFKMFTCLIGTVALYMTLRPQIYLPGRQVLMLILDNPLSWQVEFFCPELAVSRSLFAIFSWTQFSDPNPPWGRGWNNSKNYKLVLPSVIKNLEHLIW